MCVCAVQVWYKDVFFCSGDRNVCPIEKSFAQQEKKNWGNIGCVLSYFERRANLHCYIQAVHSLPYTVEMCYFYSVVTWKDIIKYLQKCEGCTLSFPTFFKYHVLCSEERTAYRIGTTWGRANDDGIFIFGWTAPLIICFQTMCLILLLYILEQRSLSLSVSVRACSKGTT